MADLELGARRRFSGNVTTLTWIGARPPAMTEKALGYAPGRLGGGYWILLLIEPLAPQDFEFAGTTLRSGGRAGLPASSFAADALRPRVHDQILAERGAHGYRELQQRQNAAIVGPDRTAKVLPDSPHSDSIAPSAQYPMGGGGLQWAIKRDSAKQFLIACHVSAELTAATPGFSVSLSEAQPPQDLYDQRRRLAQYLERAG